MTGERQAAQGAPTRSAAYASLAPGDITAGLIVGEMIAERDRRETVEEVVRRSDRMLTVLEDLNQAGLEAMPPAIGDELLELVAGARGVGGMFQGFHEFMASYARSYQLARPRGDRASSPVQSWLDYLLDVVQEALFQLREPGRDPHAGGGQEGTGVAVDG